MNTIRTVELACGMPLVVEEMSGVRSVGVSWLIPAGPAAEPTDRLGMSAMTAELLLRGAGSLDSRGHADALDRLGVGRSADASGPHIRISATMLGAQLMEALPLIADMVRVPRLADESVEPARDLALQELESLQDNPQERAVLAARSRHFPEPHGRSSLGTEQGIRAVSGDDIRRFWSARARPGGSILAIAGAVEAGAVRKRL
ncbi:insulinase family protein [Leptolyngbya sp. 15MV]|nr:insulinase family protein [Leptolyngbya sp. 15MV]